MICDPNEESVITPEEAHDIMRRCAEYIRARGHFHPVEPKLCAMVIVEVLTRPRTENPTPLAKKLMEGLDGATHIGLAAYCDRIASACADLAIVKSLQSGEGT